MCAQMLGKARLALSPPQPEWLHTALYLDGRGFTTGATPWGPGVVALGIDVYDTPRWVRASDGRGATIAIGDGRCVAQIWTELHTALAGLGIELDVWEKPQELADTTPFSESRRGLALLLPGRGDGIGDRPPGRSSD